jgi:response regulator of citrate/malate metabolism
VNNAKAVEKESRQFVTVAEAAKMLTLSEVSIRRYLGQKKLKCFKVAVARCSIALTFWG